jgi:Protein of unknown function (DUF3300)
MGGGSFESALLDHQYALRNARGLHGEEAKLAKPEHRQNPAPALHGEKKMIRTITKQLLCVALSFLLVIVTMPADLAAQAPPAGSTQPAPLTADELQQLLAPIALYPDALVAQVLGAATFPDQVAYADAQNRPRCVLFVRSVTECPSRISRRA